MRFASLGSGSRGNATLVQSGRTCVMVDCGFSIAETTVRLARLGITPEYLAAVLVTHEHADHVSGVARFAARHRLPVWCTAGTLAAGDGTGLVSAGTLDAHADFILGDLCITPVTVPHDAREPVQFVFADGRHRFGMLTDTGSITPHIRRLLDGCDALMLECNHDRDMLESGPYPAPLKARVGGALGHLSNAQAATLLTDLDYGRLQHLVAAHLSDTNNTPVLACQALAQATGCVPAWIQVATQGEGCGWRELH